MDPNHTIETVDDPALETLCEQLAQCSGELDIQGGWPEKQLQLCGRHGVFRWFLPRQWGGFEWSELDCIRGYLRLSGACLTTTFVITQRSGACRRIAASDNTWLKERLLPDLAEGSTFATVGISHLTTSRRHLARPVLRACQEGDDWVLDGFSPWVTGGVEAQAILTGATLDDGRQILAMVPTDQPGVSFDRPADLVGFSSSMTGAVRFDAVRLDPKWLLAPPMDNIMVEGVGARPGGLQTSTLAIGMTSAAVSYLEQEQQKRPGLSLPTGELRRKQQQIEADLLELAQGHEVCSQQEFRARANSLALRAAQAALAAAKGSGYVVGHPAGRWCREALFFLVWSCPEPVMEANLCELAGLAD